MPAQIRMRPLEYRVKSVTLPTGLILLQRLTGANPRLDQSMSVEESCRLYFVLVRPSIEDGRCDDQNADSDRKSLTLERTSCVAI